ncbi:MAG: HAMP domain-containing sensor histidine kinase, partial [Bacillus sp. (in: firmicutes)]
LIMIIGSSYFYGLFYLYPETWSSFIFICFIPALSILFFDAELFYFSLVLNVLLYIIMYSYILVLENNSIYTYMEINIVGNIINFVGSQAILYFIFQLTFARVKKQQLYYEQLQQSERLKTTGQLAAAVAHEIRNPLTVVKGFLQLYEKDEALNEQTKRNFTLMCEELEVAEQVISQFLMVAKPDKDKKTEQADVTAALKSVTDLITSYGLLRDNNINVNTTENCFIIINLIEFKQLMINLIKNAIEASNDGQSVEIEIEKHKKTVEIRVIDQGIGMGEEEIRSLGTPFYSLKSKGTGLGMMICFNIVEKYNGNIHFISKKGEGTTVIITFPLEVS